MTIVDCQNLFARMWKVLFSCTMRSLLSWARFGGENSSCTTAMFFRRSFVVKMRNLATDQIFAQVNIKIQHAMSLHLSLKNTCETFSSLAALRPLDGHQDDTELDSFGVSSFQFPSQRVVVSKYGYAVKTTPFKSYGD